MILKKMNGIDKKLDRLEAKCIPSEVVTRIKDEPQYMVT